MIVPASAPLSGTEALSVEQGHTFKILPQNLVKYCLVGIEFQFFRIKKKKSFRVGSGDGCTAIYT